MVHRVRQAALVAGVVAVVMAATASVGAAQPRVARATGTAARSVDPWTWPGTAKRGYLPPHEPAVHPGPVKVGLVTGGTVHDHGYYQSEATVLQASAKRYRWTPIIRANVPYGATSLTDAENMCAQGVDLLIIGESQIVTAAKAAKSTACKGTPVWIYGSTGTVTQRTTTGSMPYLSVAQTTVNPQSFATGVAMGLWLKAHHQATAGFITGPVATFTKHPAQAYLAGMRYVVHGATMDADYTGTFTSSGKAVTAASAMVQKGIKLIYPFLGGSLFPTAKYVVAHGGATASAGGAWCSHEGVKFAIEQVYNPGYDLAPALTAFAHGKLRVGLVRTFVLGRTTHPSVSFCPGAGVSAAAKKKLESVVKALADGRLKAATYITATPAP